MGDGSDMNVAMRICLASFALAVAACGGRGGAKLPDFAAEAPICPTDTSSVKDGDACGAEDVDCGDCTPTCTQPCVELFCQNGAWIHVQENGFCDLGTSDGG